MNVVWLLTSHWADVPQSFRKTELRVNSMCLSKKKHKKTPFSLFQPKFYLFSQSYRFYGHLSQVKNGTWKGLEKLGVLTLSHSN